LFRVVAVKRCAKLVGLFLIAVTLVIVVAPDFDLPPTVTRSLSARHTAPPAFTAMITASIAILPQRTAGSPVQAVFPGPGAFAASLIDLNCTRLC
jgi:hypothetical protein